MSPSSILASCQACTCAAPPASLLPWTCCRGSCPSLPHGHHIVSGAISVLVCLSDLQVLTPACSLECPLQQADCSPGDLDATGNQFALASGREKAEGCSMSSRGFSLHESRDCLFCLTHDQTDLQYCQSHLSDSHGVSRHPSIFLVGWEHCQILCCLDYTIN